MLSGRKVDISRPKSVRLVNRDNSAELNRKVKGCELNSFQRFSNADHRLSSSSSCNSINQNGRRTSTVGEEEPDDDDENNNNGERVRTRIISFWNQVKYGWMVKMKSNFHLESPVWLLGICYCRQGSIPVFCAHPSNSPDDSNCIESSIESDSAMNYQPADSFVNSIECIELFFPPFESTPQVRSLVCCTESPTFTLDRLKHDLYSRIWLTYRKEFPKIAGSAFTSDCGWGCMLRSAQMLLAQTLICHFLNRSWRWTGARSDKEDMIHRMLIKWFADADSSFHCPFSIHQLVKHGLRIGKKPGDWYGPASAAIILRESLQEASKSNFVLSNLCVYVAQDCTINVQEVIQLCTAKSISKDDYRSKTLHQHFSFNYAPSTSSISGLRRKSRNSLKSLGSSFELASNASKDNAGALKMSPLWSHSNEELQYNRTPLHSVPQNLHSPTDSSRTSSSSKSADSDCAKGSDDTWKAVLILVPLRLGGEKFNTIYTDCIRKLFCMPLCVGIIGGKPKHSMYFVGCQDDKLICLDPHYSQETIDVIMDNNFPLESYHCSNTKKLLINRMDPSCTIAFYCKTRHDLNVLKQFTRNELRPSARDRSISDHAIFFFEETVAATATEPASSLGNSDCASKCSDHTVFNQNHDEDDESTDRNDFVLL